MNSIKADIINRLEHIYFVSGYMERYGSDLWITIIMCIVFFCLINSYHLSNTLEVIKGDWSSQKCNPIYMPFAGFINKPTNQSYFDFTADNFTNCIHFTLKGFSIKAINPFQSILKILNKAVQNLLKAFNMFRALIDKLRKEFKKIFDTIYSAGLNLCLEFLTFMIKFRDTMGKINGVLSAALYVLFGTYMTMQSLFLSIIDFLTLILIIIAACIVIYVCVATGLFSIPIVGPGIALPTIIIGLITMIIMILILVLVIMFQIFMMRVLDLSTPPLPSVPGCFSGTTLIPLFESEKSAYIKNIRIGDKLKNGSIVTATIKFSAAEQNIYCLNGVIVTGEHRVFHPVLYWIKVKEHPDSLYLPDFNEPYVYCLNTDTKAFGIADTLFSDWDDVDTKVWNKLREKCVEYLPLSFTGADIHKYLDSGFHSDTKIKLNNGEMIPIDEVKVNDILWDNTKVVGIIEIAGHDIIHYKHTFENGASLVASKNIHINDENLGIINCMTHDSTPIEATPFLYNLLTDTKYFVANAIKVHDYNYGIDAYLC
jgi:hypothetical protein